MKFRTEISFSPDNFQISYTENIGMFGSCFVENLFPKLQDAGFHLDVNPFGVIYNPLSISQSLYQLLDNKKYTKDNLFQDRGIYHSFSHHSRFSGIEADAVRDKINSQIEYSSAFLRKTNVLIITFGTAYVYRLKPDGRIVANCHKQPDSFFLHYRLSIKEIVEEWTQLLAQIHLFNPDCKVLFTVSPIRHWKNGAHENQLSKSTLLLAIDELTKTNQNCYYFPSYEILLDDLRDYRFYKEDMIHPSDQAIEYIWEKFASLYFNEETKDMIKEWNDIQRSLNHKPFNPESEQYLLFRKKAEERQEIFLRKKTEKKY